MASTESRPQSRKVVQAFRRVSGSSKGDFGINNALDGLLPGAFMVGLLLSSPVFAECNKTYNSFRLIAVGLGTWTIACAACGLAPTFTFLAICRMFVGVGEASFVALAAPFIDDNAPAQSKAKWLATFYLCIPTGYALGYILGGILAGPLGWRGPFLLEAAVMSPFVLLCCFAPPMNIKGTKAEAEGSCEAGSSAHPVTSVSGQNVVLAFAKDLQTLWRHPVYIAATLGSAVYTGVIGAFSYLGPKSGKQVFGLSGESADVVFGVVTVLTGVLGTLLGGVALDRLRRGVTSALNICVVCTLTGFVAVALSFLFAPTIQLFVGPFALGELFLFGLQAPQNAVVLWSVPPDLRPFAISISIVLTHLLGDVPSPTLLGWLQDSVQNWRLSMTICSGFLLLSASFFFLARILSLQRPDYVSSPEPESLVDDPREALIAAQEEAISSSQAD